MRRAPHRRAVSFGHEMGATTEQGKNLTLPRVGKGIYRGETVVSATFAEGGDLGIQLGDTRVSFAGEKGWNSNPKRPRLC